MYHRAGMPFQRLALAIVCAGAAAQTGRVVMENGDPAPKAGVLFICDGEIKESVYTDSKGHFAFSRTLEALALGASPKEYPLSHGGEGGRSSSSAAPDASSKGSHPRAPESATCILRALSAGFQSRDIGLHEIRDAKAGLVVLHPTRKAAPAVDLKTLAIPEKARRLFDGALAASRREQWDEAREHLEAAVQIHPDYTAAWLQLGAIHQRRRDNPRATAAYQRALDAEPASAHALLALTTLAAAREDWPALLDYSARLIALNPAGFAAAHYYNASAKLLLGRIDDAEAALREARRLDPEHRVPKIELLAAAICEQREDAACAAEAYQRYLELAPDARNAAELRTRIIDLRKLLERR